MVRGKTQMRLIENATSRQVTFSKRRNGLLKKAFELSVLCDAEVALIIFSPRGKLYEFASCSMHHTIERYQKHAKEIQATNPSIEHDHTQHLKLEAASMMKKIEQLEASKGKLLGQGLGTCTIEELQQLERQLERSVNVIRARKMQVYKQQIEQLKEKERALAAENALLYEKVGIETQRESRKEKAAGTPAEISEISDVETDLFIGPPETRNKRHFPK
ncbi:MADS-box protein SOC1 [Striga hermonthica]|uniref:MADS-box protein SOC1 n=1 Tax=Striga hermonthica TaxID=68872 RepID=A0A9N7RBW9_STRHE|nr:MADS-box protein SOC1 [Striga hermonthica]